MKKFASPFLACTTALLLASCGQGQTQLPESEVSPPEASPPAADFLEDYNGWDEEAPIPLSSVPMLAAVSPADLLEGAPVLYRRFQTEGWVFEVLMSDHRASPPSFLEEGVLVVSPAGAPAQAQVLPVTPGGYETNVPVENSFLYTDVNFDGLPDLLICTGHHGNQGLLTYYCFLQSEVGFYEAPSFTDIPNPAIDLEHQRILGQWRNAANSHSWAEYPCQDGVYTRSRVLTEAPDPDYGPEDPVWVWRVNGEEIGRSDQLTDQEILDLVYNENSDWGVATHRWRALYDQGLMADCRNDSQS